MCPSWTKYLLVFLLLVPFGCKEKERAYNPAVMDQEVSEMLERLMSNHEIREAPPLKEVSSPDAQAVEQPLVHSEEIQTWLNTKLTKRETLPPCKFHWVMTEEDAHTIWTCVELESPIALIRHGYLELVTKNNLVVSIFLLSGPKHPDHEDVYLSLARSYEARRRHSCTPFFLQTPSYVPRAIVQQSNPLQCPGYTAMSYAPSPAYATSTILLAYASDAQELSHSFYKRQYDPELRHQNVKDHLAMAQRDRFIRSSESKPIVGDNGIVYEISNHFDTLSDLIKTIKDRTQTSDTDQDISTHLARDDDDVFLIFSVGVQNILEALALPSTQKPELTDSQGNRYDDLAAHIHSRYKLDPYVTSKETRELATTEAQTIELIFKVPRAATLEGEIFTLKLSEHIQYKAWYFSSDEKPSPDYIREAASRLTEEGQFHVSSHGVKYYFDPPVLYTGDTKSLNLPEDYVVLKFAFKAHNPERSSVALNHTKVVFQPPSGEALTIDLKLNHFREITASSHYSREVLVPVPKSLLTAPGNSVLSIIYEGGTGVHYVFPLASLPPLSSSASYQPAPSVLP